MPAKIRVYPYKQGSRSAKALAEKLGGMVLRHEGSKFRPRDGDLVINWGSGPFGNFGPATVLNPDAKVAANKLSSFKELQNSGVRIPKFATTKRAVLDNHLEGWPVVCRQKLTGHSGEGIVIANNAGELVEAPLYTQYIKKKDEYRVHVMRDKAGITECFFVQRKARKLDVAKPNWQVRNLEGGFVFAEVELDEVPQDVLTQAQAAIAALGLDFGGVDVIWNEQGRKAYVLEINTACGLEERTAQRYAEQILRLVQN